MFYQIVESFAIFGKGFEIENYGKSLKYSAHEQRTLVGISALGVQDVSLNNGIEEYEWEFCIENFKEDLEGHSFDKKKCISIGIINTEQHNIDISNVNAQKIAMNGNMDQCQKIKAYSIELDGKTKTRIESCKTSNSLKAMRTEAEKK